MEIKDNVSQDIANKIFNDDRLEKLPKLREVLSGYYANADESHMLDHIDAVKQRAISMMLYVYDRFDIIPNALVVLLAIELHDVGSCIDRAHHDKASLNLIQNDETVKNFLTDELQLTSKEFVSLAYCILQHGSHFSGKYYSIECEVVASADRDNIDIYEILYRSAMYSKKHFPDNAVENTVAYNISRYKEPFNSPDYHVPNWHFDYYKLKDEAIWDKMKRFFSNKEAVVKVVECILRDEDEYTIRNYIEDVVRDGVEKYSEVVEVRKLFTGGLV